MVFGIPWHLIKQKLHREIVLESTFCALIHDIKRRVMYLHVKLINNCCFNSCTLVVEHEITAG